MKVLAIWLGARITGLPSASLPDQLLHVTCCFLETTLTHLPFVIMFVVLNPSCFFCGDHLQMLLHTPTSLTALCHWQDLPRSPVAPPLDSCFLRPARPANRRPPSRWAAHSPASSPKWSEGSKRRFTFPPPGHRRTILEGEEPA